MPAYASQPPSMKAQQLITGSPAPFGGQHSWGGVTGPRDRRNALSTASQIPLRIAPSFRWSWSASSIVVPEPDQHGIGARGHASIPSAVLPEASLDGLEHVPSDRRVARDG